MYVKRSLAIIMVCFSFTAGLMIRHSVSSSWQLACSIAVLTTILVAILTKQLIFALCIGVFLLLGFWRSDAHEASMNRIRSLYGQKVIAVGTIADDPAVNDRGFLQFTLDATTINGLPLSGSYAVRTYNQKLRRGYKVVATSKLDGTLGNKKGELVYATIQVQSSKFSGLEEWRQRYFAGMRSALPEPGASFVLGLLLGTRGLISSDVQDMLRVIGLTHLIAVSGYNLTILVNVARKPLRNVSKFLALAMPLWFIFVFMLLTGFSASVVRAAIVSGLSLLAGYYGRAYKPMVLLMLSGLITLAYNPAYLWSDVGWQLSFLAFYGILIVSPLLTTQFRARSAISKMIVESLAAYIMTLPLIMALFGNISIISPVANLLIVPLTPLVMLAGFLTALFGIATPLAPLIALPLRLLLFVMLWLMNTLANVPMASITIPAAGLTAYALYVPILIFTAIMHIQAKRRSFMVE